MTDLERVSAFATALDRDDFVGAGEHLTLDCTYHSPKGAVNGRDAILESYAAAARRGRNILDNVTNSSAIQASGRCEFVIEYTDQLRAGRLTHTYRCQQHVRVSGGRITHIVHVEVGDERPRLEVFLRRASRRVIVVAYPGCILYEVMLAIELVGEHTRVVIVSPDGQEVMLRSGVVVSPEFSFAAAPRANVVGVLIPGGDPGELVGNSAVSALLCELAAGGAVLAAICAGPLLLGQAGVLRGKQFTHGYGDNHREILDRFWTGATYREAPVIEDGSIITAQPQAHIEFAGAFAERLGILDADARAKSVAFYLGQRTSRGCGLGAARARGRSPHSGRRRADLKSTL